jgi:hypothetical protein
MVCHAFDEFNDISLNIYLAQKVVATAVISSIRLLLSNFPTRLSINSLKAIINTMICIPIAMLFNVMSLLMNVIILLALQFLLALCGDVHPNPSPCNSKELKTRKFNIEGKNSPSGSHGASAKMIGHSINILNWNARGLGRVQDQKIQDLLRLMSEKDVQLAIVSETSDSAGSHNQSQTQANGYTIYKNAYHDKSPTSRYLPPEKMVWVVSLIVRNGLAFSISKIHDLALGACLVHGTLTIPAKDHAQPMELDILGVYGPATKEPTINVLYWKALSKYVGDLHKLHQLKFTQGSRHIIIGGDWNPYLDQNLNIYRDYDLLIPESIDPYLSDFVNGLANENLFLTDLMEALKLTPYADYTHSTKKLANRSILDRVFTTIDKQHCDPTSVLDWGENFSNHRPVHVSVNLHSLCNGRLEYPQQQFTLPRINLDTSNEKKMKHFKELVERWCESQKREAEGTNRDCKDELETQYKKLQETFVEIPSKAFPSGTKKKKD